MKKSLVRVSLFNYYDGIFMFAEGRDVVFWQVQLSS